MNGLASREVLARNVWRLRTAQGMTQAQLGGKIGYRSGASCVSDVELAVHSPTLDTLDRFAAALGISAVVLLTPQAEDGAPA